MARRTGGGSRKANGDTDGRIRARNEARILQVSVRLFSAKGFDGTTISEIAEDSDLPKANVYYYFQSKAAIYERLIAEVFDDWDAALRHIRPERDAREALGDYVREKLESSRRNAAQSRFFAGELLRGGKFLSRRQRRHMLDVTHEACAAIDQWIAEKRFPDIDPRHFLIMIWATTQFYSDFAPVVAATLEVPRLRKSEFDDAAEQILKAIKFDPD
ncbi:TetR family transcriptional regulator C-terminal domain-containing protein [Pseudohoeflea coraliihabitans]|uniref:TetR family transcriptional regulator C-terminal domain-containing protein n=1 Tax=Pseudohoeflea coraliihabitans TaxID=2860393 RepID=A0ABS6WLM3_9HYPH|nr:TetR family transcriptional regulator C-terminal domain-containing protein [Pseudohoeflea sp. DP4N28-3]MBW3095969.1 TetR family transcriptional regulator C-terminal domain-containing protein [Pseudohoeflea sp. DP4N28-3]